MHTLLYEVMEVYTSVIKIQEVHNRCSLNGKYYCLKKGLQKYIR